MPRIILPPRKPRLGREDAVRVLSNHNLSTDVCVLLFVRGYYRDSMGKFGVNDVGVYDDAVFVVTPEDSEYRTYNANTDPSKSGSGLAMIDTGLHYFYKGQHRGKYDAFRYFPEGTRVPCTRDGRSARPARYINIHRGGFRNTWSEGCLTIPTEEMWLDFQKTVYRYMDKYNQGHIAVLLVEEKELHE